MSRLPAGGLIDRRRPLRFTFQGRAFEGFAGDTLASALLANDVSVITTSPILGRPRGIMTAGPEEPCGLVEVSEPWFDVLTPATMVPLVDGMVARGVAGVGRLPPDEVATPRTEHRQVHVDTLVIGGGVSGLTRATAAATEGDRVMVVEERHLLGGTHRSLGSPVGRGGPAVSTWVPRIVADLRAVGATILTRAVAMGIYDHGYVVVYERSAPTQRLWHVRARRVVVATGAQERPIAFADNDRPGIMLAGAMGYYRDRFAVAPAPRQVILSTRRSPRWREDREDRHQPFATVVLPLASSGSSARRPSRAISGGRPMAGWTVVGTEGSPELTGVRVGDGTDERLIPADQLLVSGGWDPQLGLYRALGGGVRYDPRRDRFLPDGTGPPWLEVVGRATGRFGASWGRYPFVPGNDLSRHFVDFQRDQTVADIAAELEGGLRSVEHVKRATYIGTAVDQGRTSAILAAEIVDQLLGAEPGAQGPTTARPPAVPIPFHVLAGPNRGELFDPVRTTPIHPWHVRHGAVFEDVGQWKRPRYFPEAHEDMDSAVWRECLAVRTAVGMQDASTLGKIEVVGPDAGGFLDRMYTNAMSTLAVGRIRYGLMVGLDGMVFDDGVAMRLAQDRYLVTTTTGGAGRVLDRFEEWLQTEWPDLRVYCTSVTEQWATIAVAGPRTREVLAAAGASVDLSNEAFPFMTWRDGAVAGLPARLARVSFSGELAIEVNVAGWHGLSIWEALRSAGQPYGLVPYGTEAMHVLRAEKGFAIVGQDTDGTVTPDDLGMSWIVNMAKGDFVGRRSLRRPDLLRPDRKQLVGLLTEDPQTLLPEGTQLVREAGGRPPIPMLGHVTSSYRSPALGRTFALALLKGGHGLHGTTVHAALRSGAVPASVTPSMFYDPEGARRDG